MSGESPTGRSDDRAGRVSRRFAFGDGRIFHEISIDGAIARSSIATDGSNDDALSQWWRGYLRGEKPETMVRRNLRSIELFSGAGGLATGVRQAVRELGFEMESVAAVDQDLEALKIYSANHGTREIVHASATTLVDVQVRGTRDEARFLYPPEPIRKGWESLVGTVDVLLAGPPCQGHSNLNNHTRRTDKRNELYLTVPAVAIALKVPVIVIENVRAVVHDRIGVVASTIRLLRDQGYEVETGVLHADRLGWPQRRARYFLIARRESAPLPIADVASGLSAEPRPVSWAFEAPGSVPEFMTEISDYSEENRRRIDWLFDHDAYDLPMSERPDCHRDGTTYLSVYGRLHPDRPAPTITTGFMTMGRGRNIHPTERRGLNPLEAARLQGFPDNYVFQPEGEPVPPRRGLVKWIGDAVPMPLGYAAALSALGPELAT